MFRPDFPEGIAAAQPGCALPTATGSVGVPKPGIDPLLVALLLRRWRAACLLDVAVQPALHAILAPRGLAMLAPVFDALFKASAAALGRDLQTGCGTELSADERGIAAALLGSGRRNSVPCPLFGDACWSARIMLELVLAEVADLGTGCRA